MPTLKQAHLQFAQANRTKPKLQKSLLCQRTKTQQMDRQTTYREEERRHNTGLAKVAVQCSADTFVVNQSLVLSINICGENRHLRQARNRWWQACGDSAIIKIFKEKNI